MIVGVAITESFNRKSRLHYSFRSSGSRELLFRVVSTIVVPFGSRNDFYDKRRTFFVFPPSFCRVRNVEVGVSYPGSPVTSVSDFV